ncbi:MAG: hypothetical protein H0T76_18155 [Nannocystis sp.]|nr:hypothetical protein [Nannocystis sp.]
MALGLLICACTAAPKSDEPDTSDMAKVAEKSAAASPAVNEAGLPDAAQLLAASVDAMGGAAKFDALTSYYSEVQVTMGGLGLTGVAKTWWRGGDYYSEMEMPGVGMIRTGSLDGKPWSDDPINGVRALDGKEAEQAAWSMAMTLCLAPEWKRHFKAAETTAVTQIEGKQIAEVTLTSALGDRVVLRLDVASKLPVSHSFTQASPLGDTPATIYFKDFRVVEGMNIPFQQVMDTTLTKAVTTMTRFEVNGPTDAAKFAMPGTGVDTVTPGKLVDGAKIDPEKAAAAQAAAAEKAAKAEPSTKRKPGKG